MENQTNDLNKLSQMFNEFEQKQQQNKKKTSEEILAKYFVPRKPNEVFRILPPQNGRKHIEEAYFHYVPINANGGVKRYSTIYCPRHNDPKVPKLGADGKPEMVNGHPVMIPAPCPLCDKYDTLIAKQDNSLKGIKKEDMNDRQLAIKDRNDKIYKEAIKWKSKKYYIIRGIDRNKISDGVKFWRFKDNFKNQGTLDKLMPVLKYYFTKEKADFASPQDGTDLFITMGDSEMIINGAKKTYKQITAIMPAGKSKLHEDPYVIEQLLADETTWRDVFLPKRAPGVEPIEYLNMVVDNENPYWDDSDPKNKKWVFPNHPELEAAANNRNRDLGASKDEFEQASDLDENGTPISISNIKPEDVGKFEDDAVDVGAKYSSNVDDDDDNTDDNDDGDEFDDLPF